MIIGCLQLDVFFPGLSPTHWSTTIGPLLVVLSINAVKEMVDDYGRHVSDAKVNARTVEVIRVVARDGNGASSSEDDGRDVDLPRESREVRTETVTRSWRDLSVGDVVRVRGDVEIPADVLVFASSDANGLAYVETANLDGETNLKVKTVAAVIAAGAGETRLLKKEAQNASKKKRRRLDETSDGLPAATSLLRALRGGRLECETPNNQLYTFEGKWIVPARPESHATRADPQTPEDSRRVVGVSAENVLLRGSTLRNTKWALGVVVFTGGDSKLMQNATRAPRKTSRLETHMNVLVVFVGVFQIAVAAALAGAQREWVRRENPETARVGSDAGSPENGSPETFARMRHWYLTPSNTWPDVEGTGVAHFFTQFVRFVVLLNALIPISLYVTLEVVKVLQCGLIRFDRALYDPENDQRCGVRTTTLNEELGAVQCVLSDKTGTLTRNVMAFVKCSVDGVVYERDPETADADAESADDAVSGTGSGSEISKPAAAAFAAAAFDRDADHEDSPEVISSVRVDFKRRVSVEKRAALSNRTECLASATHTVARSSALANALRQGDSSVAAFVEHLSTCHTVVPDIVKDARGGGGGGGVAESSAIFAGVKYQASSPDEEALVTGAALLGSRVVRNAGGTVAIQRGGGPPGGSSAVSRSEIDTVQILAVNEFTSARKRMSVLVRDARLPPGRQLRLRLKGADAAVLARCSEPRTESESRKRAVTRSHVDAFAAEGLRTLVLAEREVSEEECEAFMLEYAAASASVTNREDRVAEVAERIEANCVLVGVTAVEDKLQDGVPETIERLREAGMLVWMLTGDKLETAVSIANTCRLIDKDGDLIVVRERDFEKRDGASASASAASAASASATRLHSASDADPDPFLQKKLREAKEDASLGSSFGLVIEGGALRYALREDNVRAFLELCDACSGGVVCCRVSPIQKAAVAEAMKKMSKKVVLGVGDGANDVGLIQSAHVGIGISGREGRAAVMASDFSVGNFASLARLLLVHGRFSAKRNKEVVFFAFYKNFCYAMCNCWFGLSAAFSSTALFPTAAIATFNVLWTSLPTTFHAVLDQDVTIKSALRYPRLYLETASRDCASGKTFLVEAAGWTVSAAFASSFCFFAVFVSLGEVGNVGPAGSAYDGVVAFDHASIGLAVFTAIILTCDLKIATRTNHWTTANVLAVSLSVILWFPFVFALGVSWSTFGVFADVSDAHVALFHSPRFWLSVVLAVACVTLADLVAENFRRIRNPSLGEVVREEETRDARSDFRFQRRSSSARVLRAFASRTFKGVERFVAPLTGGGSKRGDGLPTSSAKRAWNCARRKSRNPSVLEVVKEHRNYSEDWNP